MEALKQPSEPLAQLKDIHLPEQIHDYPVAYGWWLLLACLLITIIFVLVKWHKHRKLCLAKKLALTKLKSTRNNDEIVTLMKWAAFQYFPRKEIASLHGEQLENFFTDKLAVKQQVKFQQLCAQQFKNKYQAIENSSIEMFKQAAHLWLSQALPPQVVKQDRKQNARTKHQSQS
jgi:ABC-type transport system involved in Fe-S cluster assembly fused permease/ATPase subunit